MAWMSPDILIPEPVFTVQVDNKQKMKSFNSNCCHSTIIVSGRMGRGKWGGGWGKKKKKRADNQPILSHKSKFCSKLLLIITYFICIDVKMKSKKDLITYFM